MYAWLWHRFPGGLVGRLLCSVLLLTAAVALLFLVVFPRLEVLLPFQDVTVDAPSTTPAGAPTASPSATGG
ncbi:MAG: hypothetical protein ABIO67_04345 [Mycobacteriales bacterium]